MRLRLPACVGKDAQHLGQVEPLEEGELAALQDDHGWLPREDQLPAKAIQAPVAATLNSASGSSATGPLSVKRS